MARCEALSEAAGEQSDVLTLTESRLLESRLKTLMIPSSRPIDVAVGSGFGFRADPFTGRGALHTGLDFPSPVGTEIHAAAGGVVRTAEMHPEYGLMLEIDHGNGLMTRYGHTSKILVKVGDLVKRGQVVADVGTTGRSTGPHLHFEVLVDGIPQDPQRFLAGPERQAGGADGGGPGRPAGGRTPLIRAKVAAPGPMRPKCYTSLFFASFRAGSAHGRSPSCAGPLVLSGITRIPSREALPSRVASPDAAQCEVARRTSRICLPPLAGPRLTAGSAKTGRRALSAACHPGPEPTHVAQASYPDFR